MRRTTLMVVLSSGLIFGACDKAPPADAPATPGAAAQAAPTTAPAAPASPAAAPGALPAGHPPVDPALPPGHPAIGGPGAAPTAAPAPGGPIDAGGVRLVPPTTWVAETPSSQMRVAQYRLPHVEGDEKDGEASVIVAGGDENANIQRWRGQFEGSPEAKLETWPGPGGKTVTFVRIEGTFSAGGMAMNAPAGPGTPGTLMLALIVPTESGQSVFVKAWGPKATMEAAEPGFRQLVAPQAGE